VFVCALIAVAVFTIIRCCFGPISQSGDAETGVFLVGGDQSKSGNGGGLFQIDLDDLKLDDVIHRFVIKRFIPVWLNFVTEIFCGFFD